MLIQHFTDEVNLRCLGIKQTFLEIGKLLIDIRNNKYYEPKYLNFTEYLKSGELNLCQRMSYNLISVYEKFGVQRVAVDNISLRTLIQLSYVSDKVMRDELVEEAKDVYTEKTGVKEFYNKIKRVTKRTNPVVRGGDTQRDKVYRLLKSFLTDIDTLKNTYDSMYNQCNSLMRLAFKYNDDVEIKGLKDEIKERWFKWIQTQNSKNC